MVAKSQYHDIPSSVLSDVSKLVRGGVKVVVYQVLGHFQFKFKITCRHCERRCSSIRQENVTAPPQEDVFCLLCLVSIVSICEASNFKFSLTRTADWQYEGRCIKYTLKMIIPESTQLKTKIKLPFNSTAILRLKEAKITYVSTQLSFTHNTTNLTSSANDGVIDIALFDFNTVTRATFENETYIKIEFRGSSDEP
ncbi:hypothetical protein OS493_031007 [Desmophyllum pertusum]|uniref:Uncharacterized protein n=1 Tax=Desmophyllum pertusum TaxID=174260 RepID=A0A9W9ZBL8_9CNID|nr:hypothetical protein OS493_031007 [Desmophyllum pertusum]